MGQFGAAVSVLDARIIALSRIASGGEGSAILKLLEELTTAHAFSHFRAVSLLLQAAPCEEAVPALEKLLKEPELSGAVEVSFRQIIEKNTENPNENQQRTCQLKELYLLRALRSCCNDHPLVQQRLAHYMKAPSWLYASFCGTE